MPYKNIEDRRAAIRRHYYSNKDYYLEKNSKRRKQLRRYVNEIKSSTPCADCDVNHEYYVMDFDHLENKEHIISKLINSNNISVLKREISKCEVVCSNCHRIRTYKRIKGNNDL